MSNRGRKRLFRAVLGLCLTAALWLSAAALGEGAAQLRLPSVAADAQSPTGAGTAWQCVWFGSYPQAEVVDGAWDAVDGYALREGDLIRDDALYARLAGADWQDDRTALDGAEYLRVGLDSAPATGIREQHYRWDYDRPWHYFKIAPLRWRVLDVEDGRALLLADRMPDCAPFNAEDADVAWDACTLRSWLNGYDAGANAAGIDYTGAGFVDRAFTQSEREAILVCDCENLPNRDYGTPSGADTGDRLFLLSNAQVFEGENAGRYGFDPSRDYDDPAKRFTSTLYAKCMGAWWSPVEAYAGNSFWFMRTSGYTPRSVTYVCDFGYIYSKGTLVTCGDAGVLPAMWVDTRRAALADAGEAVSADMIHAPREAEAAFPVPELANPVVTADEAAPGGAVTLWNAVAFGSYPQAEVTKEADPALLRALDGASGDEAVVDDVRYVRLEDRWFCCEPIIWRVLEVSGDTALLLADRGLDCAPYNGQYEDVFWEDSDLRGWLNGTAVGAGEASAYAAPAFVEAAFTDLERGALVTGEVSNACNHYFDTACGSGTHDRVFLLSEEETFSSDRAAAYGFRPSDAVGDPGRRVLPTDYAVARGAWRSDGQQTAGVGFWLLRTNGYTRDNVVYVGEKGYLYNRGIPVTCPDAMIVPAIRVRLGAAPITRVADISSAG